MFDNVVIHKRGNWDLNMKYHEKHWRDDDDALTVSYLVLVTIMPYLLFKCYYIFQLSIKREVKPLLSLQLAFEPLS